MFFWLTLIWVGFLGARFEVGRGVKLARLKLIRIMLETWNLVHKFTHIFSFRKYTFQYQGFLNFPDVSIYFAKNQHFLAKMVPLLKAIVWEPCEIFFSSVFSFCKIKGWFMSISSLALELWRFPFIRDWPEIQKSEIPPSEFCQISGDWSELEKPNRHECL